MFDGLGFFETSDTLGNWDPDYMNVWGVGGSTNTGGSSGGSGNPPWWAGIIYNGIGLGSQIFSAYGNNPTQQIYPGIGPIGGGYNPTSILQAQAQGNLLAQQQYAAQYGQQGGVGLDDAATSITGFITRNPLLVAGAVLGVFLLMREPPRSRR